MAVGLRADRLAFPAFGCVPNFRNLGGSRYWNWFNSSAVDYYLNAYVEPIVAMAVGDFWTLFLFAPVLLLSFSSALPPTPSLAWRSMLSHRSVVVWIGALLVALCRNFRN